MSNLSQAEIDALLNNGLSSSSTGANEDVMSDSLQFASNSGGPLDFTKLSEELSALDKSGQFLTDTEKDVLGEIGNICMGASATTMYMLLGRKVNITTPRVHVYTSEEVLSVYRSPFVVVKVEYSQGIKGKNLLILKERDSILITNILMGNEPNENLDSALDEIHLSAMSEMMNQMIGSSATSLSKMIALPIDITPPEAVLVGVKTDISPFLDGSQLAVKVSFDMEIEGVLKSELMQIMSIETAKGLVNLLLNTSQSETPQPQQTNSAPKMPEPAQTVMSSPPDADMLGRKNQDERKEAAQTVNVKPMKYEAFDEPEISKPQPHKNTAVDMLGDIPLQVSVELGKTRKSINDILKMGIGSVIVLDKMAGELVEVVVNGKNIARGEVVVIDENYGVRITDIVSKDENA